MKTTTALRTVFGIFVVVVAATAAIYAQTPPTAPESPSELLEKGIYNQDAKGDLDSAIAIYQRVVAAASRNQQVAAHAQFRLGRKCALHPAPPGKLARGGAVDPE